MCELSNIQSVLDIKFGESPELDAMLLHFMTENGLEYTIDPVKNASPEQIRFLAALGEGAFFAPCSDEMFLQLLNPGITPLLTKEYRQVWHNLVVLVAQFVPDSYLRRKIYKLCRYKFRMALGASIIIPSRLMKRLLTIFMTQSGIDDPYRARKMKRSAMVQNILDSYEWERCVQACPGKLDTTRGMDCVRHELNMLEIKRLVAMASLTRYEGASAYFTALGNVDATLQQAQQGFLPLERALSAGAGKSLKILLLPSSEGSVLLDLELANALVRQGHKVILALKEGFYFDYVSYWDVETDPVLATAFTGIRRISNLTMSKNALLQELREHSLVVISEGIRERFNPYRMSITLARAWKECDLVISEGYGQYRRLFQTEHQFTRDIFNYRRGAKGELLLAFRPAASWVRKFSEQYISAKADALIAEMRQAKERGCIVMFYSGIIGSIPGQVDTAIKVINTFVADLRDRLDGVYIVNPGEHFEEGMDADDLMFMWEKVQRSGLLNVWRFQSFADIERSFELLGEKVPPVWAGKDSTYSTGCTKEMHIALDVQKIHRELQIIGPRQDLFFRRREYGVGKFCDVAIDECRV